jgi:hypothetical protein
VVVTVGVVVVVLDFGVLPLIFIQLDALASNACSSGVDALTGVQDELLLELLVLGVVVVVVVVVLGFALGV